MAEKLRIGDIFEADADAGVVVRFQYIGRHREYGEAVVVCPKVVPAGEPVAEDLFRNGYAVFYPVSAALRGRLVRRLGNTIAPEMPRIWRRIGARKGPHVETWIIEDPLRGDCLKRDLSDEERRLPIAAIWNHDFLLERVQQGWRPENA